MSIHLKYKANLMKKLKIKTICGIEKYNKLKKNILEKLNSVKK